ncbi:DinB family protein [Microbacterium sp. M1A1_1b]|uniref:DinB family protein n=1 Tax=Curtobacterium sp. VKM Ac-2922 TaxID=2929475 RepID=UPI001FB4E7D2|nr:DinB family protein [Curtobacterium sp. VKM Ac-2922]MCJ1715284.1 DinB family protein [Curtobacterium sp. VKM Ac-2922]
MSPAESALPDDVPSVRSAVPSGSLAGVGNALLTDEGAGALADAAAVKATLLRYLQKHRAALVGKLDGLAERQARWPVTPTGTNVLGVVKHVASVQVEYFGAVFGRPFPDLPPWMREGADDDADMYATLDETVADVVAFHHASAAHADATIAALDLDARGVVPWWPEEHREVTLHRVLVHMAYETARHAGHADIVREMLDGLAGDGDGNLADRSAAEWQEWREHLVDIAERAGLRSAGL